MYLFSGVNYITLFCFIYKYHISDFLNCNYGILCYYLRDITYTNKPTYRIIVFQYFILFLNIINKYSEK